MYEEVLKGIDGKILTTTDARGVELSELGESRVEPVAGYDLQISLDKNIQMYAQQAAWKVMQEKEAQGVSILLMNPQNGEIYANVNVPEYDLNDPFTLNTDVDTSQMTEEEFQDACNQMWRNPTINDTYEPGSTFKIITMAAGLSQGVVDLDDQFYCPGYKIVEDRRIHCHKRTGHGAEDFVHGAMNSWELRIIMIIFRNSVLWKRPVLIFRERRVPLCTKRKISVRWSWRPFLLASLSRLRLYSWPPL